MRQSCYIYNFCNSHLCRVLPANIARGIIRAQGITIFLVEQNAHKALQIADRGYILELGRITHSDSGENLLGSDAIRKAYLGG